MDKVANLISKAFSLFVKAYQYFISPLLGPKCRFYPTCSAYSLEALQNYSLAKAIYLSVVRLLKCHPWHVGGYDPLPHKKDD